MSRLTPPVPVMLDRKRHLRFDLNAMVAFEEATNEQISGLNVATLSMRHLRALLWACLVHDDPALKLSDVGALISGRNMSEVGDALRRVVRFSQPQAEDVEASSGNGESRSIGSESGPSGGTISV